MLVPFAVENLSDIFIDNTDTWANHFDIFLLTKENDENSGIVTPYNGTIEIEVGVIDKRELKFSFEKDEYDIPYIQCDIDSVRKS